MKQFELLFGTPVRCQTGETGKLASVMVDMAERQVTRLVIARGLPLLGKGTYTVPVATVKGTRADTIWLSLPCSQIDEATDPANEAGEKAADDDSRRADTPPTRKFLRRNAAAQLCLDKQTKVSTLHRTLGHVEGLIVDATGAAITQLVVRHKRLRSEAILIPMRMVEQMGEDDILLNVSSDMLEELPRHSIASGIYAVAEVRRIRQPLERVAHVLGQVQRT